MSNPNKPDFVILGAMKSGTSSLKYLLKQHPDVYIPDEEIAFFNLDEIFEHPDFFVYHEKDWHIPDFDKGLDEYVDWYQSFFDTDQEHDLKGEHSTTYLSSEVALPRIRNYLPEAKLIAILRDPVQRTYSHYWHNVQNGRATQSFEKTIQFNPERLLRRSRYDSHLNKLDEQFPDDQVKIVLFEEFVKEPVEITNEVLGFLGEKNSLGESDFLTQANESNYPLSLSLQLAFNSIYRNYGVKSYLSHLPYAEDYELPTLIRILRAVLFAINLKNNREKPRMNSKTRAFLEEYFNHELQSLPEKLDRNLSKIWPWFSN